MSGNRIYTAPAKGREVTVLLGQGCFAAVRKWETTDSVDHGLPSYKFNG